MVREMKLAMKESLLCACIGHRTPVLLSGATGKGALRLRPKGSEVW